MSSQNLRKLALYLLQALLWGGAILAAFAIFGGITYLHEASRHAFTDMRSEIFAIFRTESILVFVGTSLLFGIGAIRTYMARNRAAEQK